MARHCVLFSFCGSCLMNVAQRIDGARYEYSTSSQLLVVMTAIVSYTVTVHHQLCVGLG
eukprot:m.1647170 g.1647170  ORF g.1647170 m.1647170 type:complete len:59 (+) comp74209_c0_seq1:208-384(+)